MSSNDNARPGSDRLAKLASKAAEAAAIRAHQTHPDVIALAVERVRFQVDALLWAAIVMGLGFTMVNVQQFAAAGTTPGTAAWWTAWLLDPMVSLALLAVLRAEQVTARYQVELPVWATRTKWLTFAATYAMNTWKSWGLDGGVFSLSGVVLHSVPPLVVFAAAETGPGLRDRLTEAVRVALTEARDRLATDQPANPEQTSVPGTQMEVRQPVTESAAARPDSAPARRVKRRTGRGKRPAPRRLFEDFLTEARERMDTATDPTPAWCREVTGCGKTASVELSKVLRAERTNASASTSASKPTTEVSGLPGRSDHQEIRGAQEAAA